MRINGVMHQPRIRKNTKYRVGTSTCLELRYNTDVEWRHGYAAWNPKANIMEFFELQPDGTWRVNPQPNQ